MHQNKYDWIINWYTQITDYVILYSQQWEILWKNQECPMLCHNESIRDLLGIPEENTPEPGTFLFPYTGNLYSAQIDQHSLEDENLYLVRIARQPLQDTAWQNSTWRHKNENEIVALRQQIFSVSDAVGTLYQIIEECSDAYPRMAMEDMMEQLNIIKGNCCLMMKPSVLWNEMAKYYQEQEISSEAYFLDQELSNFLDSCRMILGRRLQMHLNSGPYLRAYTNRKRLQSCLLCLILYIRQQRPDTTQMYWEAQQQDDQIVLTCTAESDGSDDFPARHSDPAVPYDTPLVSPEKTIIRLFCKTYHAAVLYTNLENRMICTLRLPVCSPNIPLCLQSPIQTLQDASFSPFEILLSDISAYRFY